MIVGGHSSPMGNRRLRIAIFSASSHRTLFSCSDIDQPTIPAGLDEGASEDRIAIDLACDVTDQAAEPGAEELQLPVHPLELFGVRIAPGHNRCPLGDLGSLESHQT